MILIRSVVHVVVLNVLWIRDVPNVKFGLRRLCLSM